MTGTMSSVLPEVKLKAVPVPIRWNPDLPVYSSDFFMRTVGDEFGWLGGTDESGKLHCTLPYTILKRPGFRFVRFRESTIPLIGEMDVESEKSFLNSAMEYFRSSGFDMVLPATNNTIFRTYPDGAVPGPYGTYIKNLCQSEESLYKEIAPDYRNKIRRATKGGVKIKTGREHLDVAYKIISDTLKRSRMKFRPYKELNKILAGLGKQVEIFVAELDGVPQAGMIAPFSNWCGYDWYSGTIAQPYTGSMHLLQWEAMRHFQSLGVRRYDFTGVRISPEPGSKQEGIKNFKARFGGELVQGYMWKYSLNRLKFAAYGVAVRLLHGGDIVDKEGPKLKN